MTRTAREAFTLAFDTLGGPDALTEWARENRTDFFKLYARLIPVDVAHSGGVAVRLEYVDADD